MHPVTWKHQKAFSQEPHKLLRRTSYMERSQNMLLDLFAMWLEQDPPEPFSSGANWPPSDARLDNSSQNSESRVAPCIPYWYRHSS